MRSTDFEYAKRSEEKLRHHLRTAGAHSPYTRGRALASMVNVEQLPVAGYLNMVYDASGAVPIFFFVMNYSRIGSTDVVR